MIQLNLEGPISWGTNEIPGNPGRQLNLQDPESGFVISVKFAGEPLGKLITELAEGLSPDERRDLMPVFSGGIILPGQNGGPVIRGEG